MSEPTDDRAAVLAERARIETECDRFVGLSVDEAVALATTLAIRLRVVDRDASAWHTGELRSDRMTVDVQGGRVVAAAVA